MIQTRVISRRNFPMQLLAIVAAIGLGACASSQEKKSDGTQHARVTNTVEHRTETPRVSAGNNAESQLTPAIVHNTAAAAPAYHDDMRADVIRPEANNQISARLENEVENARHGSATVVVDPKGFHLVEGSQAGQNTNANQGHLHYRIDNAPSVATTVTKLSFHDLQPGQHIITVMPANSGHMPAGPAQRLTVTIPQGNEKYGEQ